MADIGLIGLGVMGANLSLNMAEKGYTVAVYNRTDRARPTPSSPMPATSRRGSSPARRSPSLPPPSRRRARSSSWSRPARRSTSRSQALAAASRQGRHPDRRRQRQFPRHAPPRRRVSGARASIFLGIGVSGGEEGARHGPSIMAGGTHGGLGSASRRSSTPSRPSSTASRAAALVGPEGAGHFVKTIHNGIEYADMQMIAEVYGIMRDGLGYGAGEMAEVFNALERRAAEILPDRDHRQGARRRRSADRQAAGRDHPRHAPARRAPAAGRRWRRRISACRRR